MSRAKRVKKVVPPPEPPELPRDPRLVALAAQAERAGWQAPARTPAEALRSAYAALGVAIDQAEDAFGGTS